MDRLTKAQVDQLDFMASADVQDITDERIVKALARRGLAERYVPQYGHINGRHRWRLTDAGRRKHAELSAKRRP